MLIATYALASAGSVVAIYLTLAASVASARREAFSIVSISLTGLSQVTAIPQARSQSFFPASPKFSGAGGISFTIGKCVMLFKSGSGLLPGLPNKRLSSVGFGGLPAVGWLIIIFCFP